MSPSIWTRCGGKANLRRLSGRAWRVVEAQHLLSTRRLVDTVEDQRLLEDLLDRVKPPVPHEARQRSLHWLLFTPFRYPPLRHGSRFAARHEPSLWYGSVRVRTALAEAAYYRLVFLEGTAADLGTLTTELSAFRARWRTGRGADLARTPFDVHADEIASPVSFAASRLLGAGMRADGVEAFRYPSARDRSGGINVGLFTPSAFADNAPDRQETWHAAIRRDRVEYLQRDAFHDRLELFPRSDFEVDGRLPTPAV